MADYKNIAAIILAAGYSSRMSAFKPLLPMGKSAIINMTVNSFREAGIRNITVVLGHRAFELKPVLDRMKVQYVINEEFDQGMYSSVAAGVRVLGSDVEAAFIIPVDIPLVRSHTIHSLAKELRNNSDVIYPVYQGKRGHPPLIRSTIFPEIMTWSGHGGLRSLLSQYEVMASEVGVWDEGILKDADTPDDYQRILEDGWRGDIPTVSEANALLSDMGVPDAVRQHSLLVSRVAERLAVGLNHAGQGVLLDISLVAVAGLLHDLAKGAPNHANRGAMLIRKLGFPKVAKIVAAHTDIVFDDESTVDEAAVVYLADKLVQGDRIVSIDERFCATKKKFSDMSEVERVIAGRLLTARQIGRKVEQLLGAALEEVISPKIFNSAEKAGC